MSTGKVFKPLTSFTLSKWLGLYYNDSRLLSHMPNKLLKKQDAEYSLAILGSDKKVLYARRWNIRLSESKLFKLNITL